MKKLTKRIVAMGAAVMMMGTMSVMGASAVVNDNTSSYTGTRFDIGALASSDTSKNTVYCRNLSTCKANGYDFMLSYVELGNNRITDVDYDPIKGNILTPYFTKTRSSYIGDSCSYHTFIRDSIVVVKEKKTLVLIIK